MIDKIEAKKMYDEGATLQEIGNRFKVSRQRINQIIKPFYTEDNHRFYKTKSTPTKSEIFVGNELSRRGHTIEYMPYGSSFDILVDSTIRIEVKYSSRATHKKKDTKKLYHQFLSVNPKSFDFLITVLHTLDNNSTIYIFPSAICPIHLSLPQFPVNKTRYQRLYKNAWSLIQKDILDKQSNV